MEVHHPHHVTHKKKWGEYLLEFLMLFLAVFLGFVAENFREHQDEKEKAKQYIESFYDDLKIDTSRVSVYVGYEDVKLEAFTNLPNCYSTILHKGNSKTCLLDLIKNTSINKPFKSTERTLNQLFNAGGFRLLSKEDADSILVYQGEYEDFLDFQSTFYQQAQDNIRAIFNKLINFSAHQQMFKPDKNQMVSALQDSNVSDPVLFSNDKALLNQYFNELELYYRASFNHKIRLLHLKENQTRLIQYLKNKYRLE